MASGSHLEADTGFHDLRHACATLLVCGVHPKIVNQMLGHSSASITLDTYNHMISRLGTRQPTYDG